MRCLFPKTCRVIQYTPKTDSGITSFTPTVLYDDLPCAVSTRRSPAGAVGNGAVEVVQGIRLYTLPKIVIPTGAAVEVSGRLYRRCGAANRFPTHAEYDLILEESA